MIEKKQENCPVIKFKDIDEANRYLEEWKKKLFLTDWIIKINLCEKHEMPIEDACGANQINDMAKWCNISILKDNDEPSIEKFCHEEILVHELMHCKLIPLIEEPENIEQNYYNIGQHALIEQISKSLIMAKYGIDFDWFYAQ